MLRIIRSALLNLPRVPGLASAGMWLLLVLLSACVGRSADVAAQLYEKVATHSITRIAAVHS